MDQGKKAMNFAKNPDWKDELQGFCPCFIRFPKGPQDNCEAGGRCRANPLRLYLLLPVAPRKVDMMIALLRCGAFSRKQLIAAMWHFFRLNPKAAEWHIRTAIKHLRTRGESVMRSDERCYVVHRSMP